MIRSLTKPVKILFLRNRKIYRTFKSGFGFYPNDYKLFQVALTHRSASINNNGTIINNERLEFLGDAILDAIIADFLFKKYPDKNEGFLTQMRSKIVNRDFLNSLSLKLGLNKFLISQIRNNNSGKNLYGNALEAFIGAMYIDKGYEFTQSYIKNSIIDKHIDISLLEKTNTNFKSQLLEWIQKYKLEVTIDTDSDPINLDKFISYIRIEKKIFGSGVGKSKKEAEQLAAEQALFKLKTEKI